MGRNFKMFDHIVDPDTRFRARKFMEARPLETFLFISFSLSSEQLWVLYLFIGLILFLLN